MALPAHRVGAAQRTSRCGSLREAGLRAARAGLLHVCHSACAHYGCVQYKAVPQLQAFSLDDSEVDQLLSTAQKLKNERGRSLCLSSPVRPLVPPGSLLHGGSGGESCSQRPCFLCHGAPFSGGGSPTPGTGFVLLYTALFSRRGVFDMKGLISKDTISTWPQQHWKSILGNRKRPRGGCCQKTVSGKN